MKIEEGPGRQSIYRLNLSIMTLARLTAYTLSESKIQNWTLLLYLREFKPVEPTFGNYWPACANKKIIMLVGIYFKMAESVVIAILPICNWPYSISWRLIPRIPSLNLSSVEDMKIHKNYTSLQLLQSLFQSCKFRITCRP